MAENKTDGFGSLLSNPNALLALLTIVGGVWLVSQKLTSNRPVISAGPTEPIVGDQKLAARLWEDPFKIPPSSGSTGGESNQEGLASLIEQIVRRSDRVNPGKDMLLLPVMISGGPYSEDRESRVRSRFAIVSALGQSDYVPEDAEHLGTIQVPWPSTEQIAAAEKHYRDGRRAMAKLWEECQTEGGKPILRVLGIAAEDIPATIRVRYEWYRPRTFGSRPLAERKYSNILVLWLDDVSFDDQPLVRFAMLLEQLSAPHVFNQGSMALIGPRRSSTLRAMLPKWPPQSAREAESAVKTETAPSFPPFGPLVKSVLGRTDLYSATACAMDEVLVESAGNSTREPRSLVADKLRDVGFRSFKNFAATDAQLASEVIDEIKLRGVDLTMEPTGLTKKTGHVALISEWDTFYGRMLSLTYRAELSNRGAPSYSRADFVTSSVRRPEEWSGEPKNFHSLVYLRGLDGQISGDGQENEGNSSRDNRGKTRPESIDEIREWSPDVNQAEGQAQFDYLGRMGDRLDELQRRLQRQRHGRLRAVGIVGSDVYDTLLILQALRQRFPNLLFFTTDLDVRFLHPREREWARNLIVASSYGLALHPNLQGSVAPFRDSTQTAQFAATLAALGHPELQKLTVVPPRRFEVGNRIAVDLSNNCPPIDPAAHEHSIDKPHLHPLTPSEHYQLPFPHDFSREWWALIAAALFVGGATWLWTPLRRLTWEAWAYPSGTLNYSEEDVGGANGAQALLSFMDKKGVQDDFSTRLLGYGPLVEARSEIQLIKKGGDTAELPENPPKAPSSQTEILELTNADLKWRREKSMARVAGRLVAYLNLLLDPERVDVSADPTSEKGTRQSPLHRRLLLFLFKQLPSSRRMIERWQRRRKIDVYLDKATEALAGSDEASAQAPQDTQQPATSRGKSFTDICRLYAHQVADDLLGAVERPPERETMGSPKKEDPETSIDGLTELRAAQAARTAAESMFRLRCRRLICFWAGSFLCAVAAIWIVSVIWTDTFNRADGEPFSLTSGISAWPAEIVRLGVLILAVSFVFGLSHKLREAFLTLTRSFRLSPTPQGCDLPSEYVCARSLWFEYQKASRFRLRIKAIVVGISLYIGFLMAVQFAAGGMTLRPVRGDAIQLLDRVFLWSSILGFLLLAFLTIDAARLCRRFIEKLSANPTRYPIATKRHFVRQMGDLDEEYLDEWIDVQLIAELTEKVGRLVYFPAGLILLMFLARNSWWDRWPWPTSLVVIFILNLTLALASVVILQQSAKEAKRKAEQSLAAKVKRSQAYVAPSVAHNNAVQAEALLTEIRQMNRGAFVPFWENPVVGAIFLSSGGTTLLQIAFWFVGR